MYTDLFYKLALHFTPGITYGAAQQLLDIFETPEAIFHASQQKLTDAGLRADVAARISSKRTCQKVEKELDFMEKHQLSCIFCDDDAYPERLRQCSDAPVVLFTKGQTDFNVPFVLSIVGKRDCTPYGTEFCRQLVAGLASQIGPLLIVSGMARGIDICAHRAALENGLQTAAIFGTSFETIYPPQNRKYAEEIMAHGALVSEMSSDINTSRIGFVRRNRIIAGMADATIVIESALKGGSLTTADMAGSYNREVFALPGRADDEKSEGCNWLIRTCRAHLITHADQLLDIMGWEQARKEEDKMKRQHEKLNFAAQCSEDERKVLCFLQESGGSASCDEMRRSLVLSDASILPVTLLSLEISGMVRSLPGQRYMLDES